MNIKINKKFLWSIITVLLALLTIKLVLGFSGGLSLQELLSDLKGADPLWLTASLLCMAGFVCFEGEAVLCICRGAGYRRSRGRGLIYAAADTYFSAITPSATGGQPASAYFMIKDGIPGTTVTAVLVFNLILYTLAVLANGLLCILIRPGFFWHFSPLAKLMIGLGLLVLVGLALLFWLILKKRRIIPVLTAKLFGFLHRHHLMRHPERRQAKLERMVEEYGEAVDLMTGQRRTVLLAFLFDLLQRISQIGVTFTMYMALGGSLPKAVSVYITQSMVVLGSNCVPIPGSMGVTDYLMLDGFTNLMDRQEAVRLEFLSRSVSFYLCVVLSGLAVLTAYLTLRRRQKRYRTDKR